MATRQTIIDKTRSIVGTAKNERGIEPVEVYVSLALDKFSKLGPPREVEQTITGDGTDEYALASTWVSGFSVIESVAYWASNDTNEAPRMLRRDEYVVEEDLPSDGSSQIRFLTFSPSSSDRVVVTFTAPQIVGETAATTTVPDHLVLGLAYLAASMLCDTAAASLAATVPQATDDDALISSFGTAGDAYRRMATRFQEEAYVMLGIASAESGGEAIGPPEIVAVRAVPGRSYGRRYMTHARYSRWHG